MPHSDWYGEVPVWTDPGSGTGAMTITEFARRSGLSHKALRLYDMSGLLAPADITPSSRYRLYHPDQLERARRISLLRQMDMPLAVVAEVLDGTDEEALGHLDDWWSVQEAEMRRRRATYGFLRFRMVGGIEAADAYPVAIRTEPATKIATSTRVVDQGGLVEMLIESERRLRAHLDGRAERVPATHWAIYHGFVTPDSEAPVEVCVPFDGTVDPGPDITIRIEPAQTLAYTVVRRDDCAYPQILSAYDSVRDFVARNRYRSLGPAREMYLAPYCAVAADDPFVHVAMPIDTEEQP